MVRVKEWGRRPATAAGRSAMGKSWCLEGKANGCRTTVPGARSHQAARQPARQGHIATSAIPPPPRVPPDKTIRQLGARVLALIPVRGGKRTGPGNLRGRSYFSWEKSSLVRTSLVPPRSRLRDTSFLLVSWHDFAPVPRQ